MEIQATIRVVEMHRTGLEIGTIFVPYEGDPDCMITTIDKCLAFLENESSYEVLPEYGYLLATLELFSDASRDSKNLSNILYVYELYFDVTRHKLWIEMRGDDSFMGTFNEFRIQYGSTTSP